MLGCVFGHLPEICQDTSGQQIGADKVRRTVAGALLVAAADMTGSMQPSERQYMNKMVSQLNEDQRKAALAIIENLLQACGYDLPSKYPLHQRE